MIKSWPNSTIYIIIIMYTFSISQHLSASFSQVSAEWCVALRSVGWFSVFGTGGSVCLVLGSDHSLQPCQATPAHLQWLLINWLLRSYQYWSCFRETSCTSGIFRLLYNFVALEPVVNNDNIRMFIQEHWQIINLCTISAVDSPELLRDLQMKWTSRYF